MNNNNENTYRATLSCSKLMLIVSELSTSLKEWDTCIEESGHLDLVSNSGLIAL